MNTDARHTKTGQSPHVLMVRAEHQKRLSQEQTAAATAAPTIDDREVTVTELKPTRLRNAAAAEYLGMTPGALAIMRVRKRGPRYHRDGASQNSPVYYLLSDLDAWVAERARQTEL